MLGVGKNKFSSVSIYIGKCPRELELSGAFVLSSPNQILFHRIKEASDEQAWSDYSCQFPVLLLSFPLRPSQFGFDQTDEIATGPTEGRCQLQDRGE